MKKSLNSIALEAGREEEARVVRVQEEERQRAELAEPVSNEPELVDLANDVAESEREFDDDQFEGAALEALSIYRDELQRQITAKTVSMESIQLIQMGVQNIYAMQGVRLRTVAQESNMSAEAYGTYVMESIFGALGNNFVLPIKHWKDRLTDMFRSTEQMSVKYREKLQSARQELHGAQGQFQGQAEVNMHELWGFFSNGDGQQVNITSALAKDVQLTKYMLVDYPKQVLGLINKFTQVLGSANFSTPESAKAAALSLEKLPHPADLFNKQFITGDKKPYLGVTGVVIWTGTKRSTQAIAGTALPKLAELASSKTVRELSSFMHSAKKVATPTTVSIATSKNTRMTAQQVDQAITFGEEYITYVDEFKKLEPQLLAALEHAHQAFQKSFGDKNVTSGEVGRVMWQVQYIANNLTAAAFQPEAAEITRALRGARFTGYLARRAIFHKSNKAEGANTNDAGGEAPPANNAE